MPDLAKTISIAPMMKYTDRHFRYFMRLLSQQAVLYTEMITAQGLLHGNADRFLKFNAEEHPVILQLGGSDPDQLAKCAVLAQNKGYDGVNLNVGCPSHKVQSGGIGACLMAEGDLVADCVQAMKQAVGIPVTVKTRIGIDEQDSYEFLCDFTQKMIDAGLEALILHARKAWLKGLSPKQNRNVPPLDYARVYQLKQDFPQLEIVINGGIKTLKAVNQHLNHVDGVMLGRVAYEEPWMLAGIDGLLSGKVEAPNKRSIIEQYLSYAGQEIVSGTHASQVLKPLWGVTHGIQNGKKWRITLQALKQRCKDEKPQSKTHWEGWCKTLPLYLLDLASPVDEVNLVE